MEIAPETVAGETSVMPVVTHAPSEDEGRFVPGTLLAGRYRIVGLLGKGGMGEVYRATDLTLGQSVALKFLPPAAAGNSLLLERFHGEVRVARQISHPNVCRVYDIGQADGMPFISMEYIDGEDLSSLLTRIGRLPPDKALQMARQICAGVAAAHTKGVVHRDLKPQNIMLNKRGEVVVMDFGLAAIAGQISGAEVRNGTPAYMSPEQLKGTEVTARSDIYALGLVLFELFTGKRPYESNTVAGLIRQQESAQLSSMSSIAADIDPAVENIVRRCLDPEPSKRPEDPLAISAALPGGDPLAAALAAGQTPSPELVAASGEVQGMPLKYSVLCLATILLVVLAAPFLKQAKIAFYQSVAEYPPDVLRQKSREIAAAFGYARKPADTALSLDQRLDLITYLDLLPAPRSWKQWLAAESPVKSAYRESAEPLVAPPTGDVDANNPPLNRPGMVTVDLDANGRLRGFAAVPYKDAVAQPLPVEPEAVFRAAQLDFTKFREVSSNAVPLTATDQLRAWKGPHPAIPNTEMQVRIGWWKGGVTSVDILWPWNLHTGPTARNPFLSKLRTVLLLISTFVGVAFAILLARRNWKLARVDRRGAFAIAYFQFTVSMIVWACAMHPAAANSFFDLLFAAVSDATFGAVLFMTIYLALEPALRSHWPHSIITWNRIMAGRWKDAQAGSHVLIGAAMGTTMWAINELRMVLSVGRDGLDTTGGLYLLTGSRQWIGGIVNRGAEAVRTGLIVFFLIFGLKMLFRRNWIAAIAGAVLFSVLQTDLQNSIHWQTELAAYVALLGGFIFLLLRFGLVTTISAFFFFNAVNGMTLGTDWSTWYAPTGFATMAVILGMSLWAFRISVGNRDLFGEAKTQR